MVFIWSGLGFLGLLIPAVCIFFPLAACTIWFDMNDSRKTERILAITLAVGCGLSAIALWFLGRWLNRPRKESAGNEHTMFFIPLQYWAFLWVVAGALTTFWLRAL